MSFLTCFCDLPQNEHLSRSPPSPIRATYVSPCLVRHPCIRSETPPHRVPPARHGGRRLDGTRFGPILRPLTPSHFRCVRRPSSGGTTDTPKGDQLVSADRYGGLLAVAHDHVDEAVLLGLLSRE